MNRSTLFLVILGGALPGMLPFAAFLESWMFAVLYAGGALLVALALAIRHVAAENEPPGLGELLLGALGVAGHSAGAAYIGFIVYGLAYAVAYAIVLVGSWLELGWRVDPSAAAFWTSSPITLLFGLLALSFSPIPRSLDPAVGVVSAYDGLMRRGTLKWSIPLLLGGIVLSLLSYFFWPSSWWWQLVAMYSIVMAGFQSTTAVSKWSATSALGKEAVQAVQKLYGVLGYDTVISPRTRDANADVDSLLRRFDMFATREQEALAIQLKTPMRINQAVSAADVSILPIAARAMSRYLDAATAPVHVHVQPVLVLIGRESSADLGQLAEEERVKVLSLTEEVVREALGTEDTTVLRELAQRYLLASPAAAQAHGADAVARVAP